MQWRVVGCAPVPKPSSRASTTSMSSGGGAGCAGRAQHDAIGDHPARQQLGERRREIVARRRARRARRAARRPRARRAATAAAARRARRARRARPRRPPARVQPAADVRQQAVVGHVDVVGADAHVDAAHQRTSAIGGVVVLERAEVRRHAHDDAHVVAVGGLEPAARTRSAAVRRGGGTGGPAARARCRSTGSPLRLRTCSEKQSARGCTSKRSRCGMLMSATRAPSRTRRCDA